MLFRFENTIADIDLEKTKSYHKNKIIYSSDYCRCSGCKNFKRWAQHCSPVIRNAFQKIGIEDMRYFSEIGLPFIRDIQNKIVFYSGMYYVAGSLLKTIPDSETPEVFPELPDYFQYCISDKHDLVPDDFPRPALQLDFYAYLPWIVGNSIEEL